MKIHHLSYSQLVRLSNSRERLLRWREQALRRQWAGFGTREMFTVASAGWFFPEIREAFRRVLNLLESNELSHRMGQVARMYPVEPVKGGEWRRLLLYAAHTYSSQGYGAARYAEGRARIAAWAVQQHCPKVPLRVRQLENGDAVVEAQCSPEDVRRMATTANDLPLREFVRLSWKFGCQPRVFQWSIPAGYEDNNDLDYFGNDLRAKE